jgi:hypothetical protein
MATTFTLIDEGRVVPITADVRGDRVLLEPADLERATGWLRKPQGLCRGEVCVPVRDASLDVDGRIDLLAFAAALRRPLAQDAGESAAFLGTSSGDRAEQLGSLRAPGFTLPDLDGTLHSLSDHLGKKVLLAAYASW